MLLNLYLKPENYTASIGYQGRNWKQNREIRVRIIGPGYVSLPLVIRLLKKELTNY